MPLQGPAAPGYPLQVLGRQKHGLRAFRCYPFRAGAGTVITAGHHNPIDRRRIRSRTPTEFATPLQNIRVSLFNEHQIFEFVFWI